MEAMGFLADIAILMIVALFMGYIANRLGQPAMLGYLFAGIIVGPYSWSQLINNVEDIEVLANVGVSLLLFVVGMEFSPKKLKSIWNVSAIGGAFEMVGMLFVGVITGMFLGWTITESLLLGTMLMMSSTIVIIKILHETGQTDTMHGRLLIGMLIIEDIGAIIVITSISSFVGGETDLILKFLPVIMGTIILTLVIFVGRKVFPMILKAMSVTHSKELFLLTVFGICISVAVLSQAFGLSLALGAFMAGIVLSESDRHLDIMGQITPLKEIFLVIFFVSMGMTIDPRHLIENPVPVMAVLTVLLVGKILVNFSAVKFLGYHPKTALFVGLGMIPLGEFSFIIASMGLESGLMSNVVYSSVIAAALISMVLTPYVFRSAPTIYNFLRKRNFLKTDADEDALEEQSHEKRKRLAGKAHIVVLGAAEVTGETIDCMSKLGHNFTVVDYNPKKVQELREKNIDCVYGDATEEEVQKWAGVGYAKLIIVAVSSTMDSEAAIAMCRKHNQTAYIVARAYGNHDRMAIAEHVNDVIISEEVAGRRMAWHVLRNLGLDEEAIKKDMDKLRYEEEDRTISSS